jgi:hypothetical protein
MMARKIEVLPPLNSDLNQNSEARAASLSASTRRREVEPGVGSTIALAKANNVTNKISSGPRTLGAQCSNTYKNISKFYEKINKKYECIVH